MFATEQPKSTKSLDHHAKHLTLGESLRIKSTNSGSSSFFIKAIFYILDDVGALWNPLIVDHTVPGWLKLDNLAYLETKAIQMTNWGNIL